MSYCNEDLKKAQKPMPRTCDLCKLGPCRKYFSLSSIPMTPEALAETILNAAGSALKNYMPTSKEKILAAAAQVIKDIRK